MSLENYRKQIDHIDKQLVHLLVERMYVVEQIADYKAEHNLPIVQPGREVEKLANVTAAVPDRFKSSVEALYQHIFYLSCNHQDQIASQKRREQEDRILRSLFED